MDIAAICFTKSGFEVIKTIKNNKELQKYNIEYYIKCSALKNEADVPYVNEKVSEWARTHFEKKQALLFVGAMGIAVRAIAPLASNKLEDNPVVVIDDMGRYVIPVLSGHVGGANEIAAEIAENIGATAIITTATDIHHKFAVDVFAKKNSLHIVNKNGIANVSSKVLAGEKIVMSVPELECIDNSYAEMTDDIEIVEYEKVVKEDRLREVDVFVGAYDSSFISEALLLKPREYVIGIGCKKDKGKNDIEALVCDCLEKAHITKNDIHCFASIDIKKDEQGIIELAKELQVDLLTFSSEKLLSLDGEFSESEFVKNQVGVGNVCERAAIAACDKEGTIVLHKTALNGVTVAIAKKRKRLVFDYE